MLLNVRECKLLNNNIHLSVCCFLLSNMVRGVAKLLISGHTRNHYSAFDLASALPASRTRVCTVNAAVSPPVRERTEGCHAQRWWRDIRPTPETS